MMDYDNIADTYHKPMYSYNSLIMMAITNSPRGTLTFPQICEYIQAKYPYYQQKINDGWQKSIHAQLKCGKCYTLVPSDQHKRRSKWEQSWMISPECPEKRVSKSTGRLITKRRNFSKLLPKAQETISVEERQKFPKHNRDYLEGFKGQGLQYSRIQAQDSFATPAESTCTRAYMKKEILSKGGNSWGNLRTVMNSDYLPRPDTTRFPLVDSRSQETISMGGFQYHPYPLHHETSFADSKLQVKEFFSDNGHSLDDLQAVLEDQPDYIQVDSRIHF